MSKRRVTLELDEDDLKLLRAFIAVESRSPGSYSKINEPLMKPILIEVEEQLDKQLYPRSAS